MLIHVLDTETTGLDPDKDRVVEIAAVPVRGHMAGDTPDGVIWEVLDGASTLVRPGRAIPPEASGVHHIVDADVAGAPHLGHALDLVLGPMWGNHVDVVCAHNAPFDKPFLPPLKDKRWLDSCRAARHVWPNAPSYANNALRYFLGIDLPRDQPMHRALPDAVVTAHILVRLLQERSLEDLLKLSRKAVLLAGPIKFGKHKGTPWSELPTDYLQYFEREKPDDPDVRFTVRSELARRRGGNGGAA